MAGERIADDEIGEAFANAIHGTVGGAEGGSGKQARRAMEALPSQLRQFPVTALKIDRSFVAEISEGTEGSAIPVAIITLAHSLGLAAIGERVETPNQFALLRWLGCDLAQGFYLGRPEHQAAAARPEPGPLHRDNDEHRPDRRLTLLLDRLKEERDRHKEQGMRVPGGSPERWQHDLGPPRE